MTARRSTSWPTPGARVSGRPSPPSDNPDGQLRCSRRPADPAPGYYVSTTALFDKTKPARSRSATSTRARCPTWRCRSRPGEWGAELGDLAVVMNAKNGPIAFAVFADYALRRSSGKGRSRWPTPASPRARGRRAGRRRLRGLSEVGQGRSAIGRRHRSRREEALRRAGRAARDRHLLPLIGRPTRVVTLGPGRSMRTVPAPRLCLAALALAATMVAAPTLRADDGAPPLDALAADVRREAARPLRGRAALLQRADQLRLGHRRAARRAGAQRVLGRGVRGGGGSSSARRAAGARSAGAEGHLPGAGRLPALRLRRAWGREQDVEEIVVLQAIHGDATDRAVDHLAATATGGGRVSFQDGDRARRAHPRGRLRGHNRLMETATLPAASRARRCRRSCWRGSRSRSSGRRCAEAGSTPLVTTSTLMAPEGYLIDAIARGIGEKLGPAELRRRAVAAYAKWQKLTPRQAGSVFAKR